MIAIKKPGKRSNAHIPFMVAGICLSMGVINQAQAFKIDSGSRDLTMSFDTTIRYNQGWRTDSRDKTLANNVNFDEGNYLFDKGDVMLSRLDLFSEFDLNYKGQVGLRVSAAGWYDHNFPDKTNTAPGLETQSNYINRHFSNRVKRYYSGPSGEFRDYFVWTNLDIAETSLNIKGGSFAWLPGEFVLGNGSSASYSMTPNDGILSDLSPGASAKETALPIGQIATTWQLLPELSLMLQYTYDFKESRVSEGGTYYAVADGGNAGPDFMAPGIVRADARDGDNGDVSVGVNWSPDWANNSTFGLWYRKFDDKNVSWGNQLIIDPTTYNMKGRAVHAKDIELYGLTWGGVFESVSIGAEINYRKNMPLNTSSRQMFFNDGADLDGARGKTLHGLISGVVTLNKNTFFDNAAIAAQFDFMHLIDATENKSFFNASSSEGGSREATNGCNQGKELLRGCSSKNAASFGISFTPSWLQVMPSLDLGFPMFLTYGLYGNPAAQNAGIPPQDSYLLKFGPRAEYYVGDMKHQLDLAYTIRGGREGRIAGNNAYSGLAYLHDRDTLILTYQTAF